MKNIMLFSFLCFLNQALWGQVSFTNFPQSRQLVPRDLSTNLGTVVINGSVNEAGTPFTELRLKVFRFSVLQNIVIHPLTYSGGVAAFSFSFEIPAELAQYKFEVYGVNSAGEEIFVERANNIVAGDAYLIQGQSNADAGMFNGSAHGYKSNYIRAYGAGYTDAWVKKWYYATGDYFNVFPGHVGQWGLVMARQIVDNYGIPIAIINGAEGGQSIEFFQRNDAFPNDPSSNYGRTLTRIQETGLQDHIRGVLWYQGESNAFGTNTGPYKYYFEALYNDWITDFPSIEHIYIFQIRVGCAQSQTNTLKIQEAHRQLALDHSNFHIMSTTAKKHHADICHFPFENGYELDGVNIYRLVAADCYNAILLPNSEPPQVVAADFVFPDKIMLTLKNQGDTYQWQDGSHADFKLNGTNIVATGGSISGNVITLDLSGTPSPSATLSYSGHQESKSPNPVNANGIGLLCFNKFPINNLRQTTHSDSSGLALFPNPASSTATISGLSLGSGIISWSIKDLSGRVIAAGSYLNIDGNETIDVSEIPGGFYTFKLFSSEEGFSYESSLIIQ